MKYLKTITFPVMLIVMIITVITCKKEEENKIEGIDLYGKWNWVSSISGLHGNTITPQTEGYTMSMEYKSTRKVEFRKNDTVTSEKSFSISHDAKTSTYPIINIEDNPTWSYKIKDDTLFLNNVCPTCYNEKYIRIK
jgi:hypothetical protein